MVLTSTSKGSHKKIDDISLGGAFLTLYFPYRWKDLSQYKLLILLTYQQFSGHLWLCS